MGVGILPQDVLGGLDCSFNFAIGLWVERRGGDVCEPMSLAKSANSWLMYWGPLSETTASGIPCRAKISHMWRVTAAEVVDRSFRISNHRLA